MGTLLLDGKPSVRASRILFACEIKGIAAAVANGAFDPKVGLGYAIPKKKDFVIPSGVERVAILVPGFTAPGTSVDWLAARLTSDTTYAMTWGNHANIGPFRHIIDGLVDLVQEAYEQTGRIIKIDLIGHSLGGPYALYLARRLGECVGNVYCLASPIETSLDELPDATNLAFAASLLSNRLVTKLLHEDFLADFGRESDKEPISGSVTIIGASNDSIVFPHAVFPPDSVRLRKLIVESDHCGLITKERVARLIEAIMHSGDNQMEFPPHLAKYLLTTDQLDARERTHYAQRLFDHFTIPTRKVVDRATRNALRTIGNMPGAVLDRVTSPLFDPKGAADNADPDNNVTAITNAPSHRLRPVGQITPKNPREAVMPVASLAPITMGIAGR